MQNLPATISEDGELKRISPYGDFCEGDYVTRRGDDVQLVREMSDDGYHAEFVCVKAPIDGWCEVGDVELNLCSRYKRVIWKP